MQQRMENAMSMSEYEDCFIFQCDGCGLSAEFERGGPGSFMACVGEIKSRGLADRS